MQISRRPESEPFVSSGSAGVSPSLGTNGLGTALALLAALILVAACHRQPSDKIAAAEAADPDRIECAPAGSATFDRVCHVDREESPRGLILSIVKPDGGFRRLLVLKDGRGLVAADGAQPATISIIGPASVEVAIGGDRFRLPAKLKPHAGAA